MFQPFLLCLDALLAGQPVEVDRRGATLFQGIVLQLLGHGALLQGVVHAAAVFEQVLPSGEERLPQRLLDGGWGR